MEDLQAEEDKVNHLNKVKAKMEQQLDDVSSFFMYSLVCHMTCSSKFQSSDNPCVFFQNLRIKTNNYSLVVSIYRISSNRTLGALLFSKIQRPATICRAKVVGGLLEKIRYLNFHRKCFWSLDQWIPTKVIVCATLSVQYLDGDFSWRTVLSERSDSDRMWRRANERWKVNWRSLRRTTRNSTSRNTISKTTSKSANFSLSCCSIFAFIFSDFMKPETGNSDGISWLYEFSRWTEFSTCNSSLEKSRMGFDDL